MLDLPASRTDYVFFVDEVFGNQDSWLEEFQGKYRKDIGLPFYVEYHPKMVAPVVLTRLASAGLDTIGFGIQTGSDHIRNQIFHRPGKNTEIVDVARHISRHGINIKYDLIMDNPYDTPESLRNTIRLLLELPKPLSFNLYSLQYFPGYPLTKQALEDKHIEPEMARLEGLFQRTGTNWAFVPTLLPRNKKQMLQNVIWLLVNNLRNEMLVKCAVAGDSWRTTLYLAYLNLRFILLGKILGVEGISWRHPWVGYFINAVRHVSKGEWRVLCGKMGKHVAARSARLSGFG